MAEGEDKSQKTEEPTQKRLDDAAKKGQVITSREVNSFFIMLAFALFIIALMPSASTDLKDRLSGYIVYAEDISLDSRSFKNEMRDLMADVLVIMIGPAALVIASIFAANAVQNRFVLSTEPIIPKLEKISPIKGLGRLFSRKNFVEFIKGIVKIVIVGAVAVAAIAPYKEELRILTTGDIFSLIDFLWESAVRVMIGICSILLLIAVIDFAYQRFEYLQQMRMSKQEIKDEYKQQEGDPMVKQKLRQIRRERVRGRMMEAVPEADVVITNPSHYSVALKYDSNTMNAPVIVAKGVDKVALRIREVAERHEIIIMRNPPLTRLLYDHGEVDEEIPLAYYQAVAQVIGYVYRMRGTDLGDDAKPAMPH
ncbi:MAG: flagellar biosynthesis protein FlhB [Rickettsiales bacterium]|nr:flagellar biosynthesis protein FlhB [Rickettsiales bacterium]